jgi:hypothetical protein
VRIAKRGTSYYKTDLTSLLIEQVMATQSIQVSAEFNPAATTTNKAAKSLLRRTLAKVIHFIACAELITYRVDQFIF